MPGNCGLHRLSELMSIRPNDIRSFVVQREPWRRAIEKEEDGGTRSGNNEGSVDRAEIMKKNRALHLHQLAMPSDRSKATCRKLGIHCTRNRLASSLLIRSRFSVRQPGEPLWLATKKQTDRTLPRETGTTRGMRFHSFSIAIRSPNGRFHFSKERAWPSKASSVWPILENRRGGEFGTTSDTCTRGEKVFPPIRTAICRYAPCENCSTWVPVTPLRSN